MSERPRLLSSQERREESLAAARRASEAGSGTQNYLRQLLNDPLGVGYSPEIPRHERGWFRKGVSVVLVALLTAGLVWVTREMLRTRASSLDARVALVADGEKRLADQARLEQSVAELKKQITARQEQLVPKRPEQAAYGNALAARAGTGAVKGPGIVIEIDDSGVTTKEARVRDFDLQVVVNALWASGAEAIAVDNQRLAPRTALRTAGQTILVNVSPLTPPYRIEAIGDPNLMQVEFAKTRAAGHLARLRDTLGVAVSIDVAPELSLRAAPSSPIRFAVVINTDAQGKLTG